MGIHSEYNERLLRKQVDAAARLKLKYFVLDAGWYHSPNPGWFNNNGNWNRVGHRKFPRGLEPFANYVRRKGLRFGLWFEPERASKGSDWLTQHPDWFLAATTPNGPSYNLNLALPAVQHHLIDTLSDYITRLDIRWLRWDYNQPPGPFWDAADSTGKIQFAYLAGLYRVWDALLARHPDLLLDLGWRMDLASMKRSVTTIMADYAEDPHIVRAMQTSAARIIPANYLNGFTYHDKTGGMGVAPGTVGSLSRELLSRLSASITLGGRIDLLTPSEIREIRRHLQVHRSIGHLLMEDLHPLTHAPHDREVLQFINPKTTESLIFIYPAPIPANQGTVMPRVYPVGLVPTKQYTMAAPFGGAAAECLSKIKPRIHSTGDTLMCHGIPLPKDTIPAALHLCPL